MSDPLRMRVFTWSDPAGNPERAGMSGKAVMEAVRDGRLPRPPFAEALDFTITEVDDGRVVFAMTPAEYHYNPLLVVHGGVIATILDSAMACAIQTLLPAGAGAPTLELHTNFLRPVTLATGTVYAEGRVLHLGSQTTVAEADLRDAAGKLYAHATCTCMIMRR